MKNFVQDGDTLTLAAPYALTSGQGFLVGSLFAVANADAANGATVEGSTEGVFDLAKATGQAWTQGVKVYWDNTAKNVTTTLTSNTLIGVATAAAVSGATVGRVYVTGQIS